MKTYIRQFLTVTTAFCAFTSILSQCDFLPTVNAAEYSATEEILSGPGIAVTDTKEGKLQGYVHNGVYNFKGVPYAKAERFMPPRPVEPWAGIKTAMTYGNVSYQLIDKEHDIFPPHWYWPHWEPRNYPQSDDCQNLNLWTPGLKDGKKRPVMVWIHGGGYSMGSASVEDAYDGENLSRKGDAVVVSVNHRLNSVGFLDLSAYGEKYKFSGNVGMLDIVAALQWVNRNIEYFGGDPGNVTLFGQSGGGGKVLTLTAMPKADGLYHKIIVQSGGVELTGMSLPDKEATRLIAALTLQELNLSPKDVDKLQTIPYETLSKAANVAYVKAGKKLGTNRLRRGASWSPVIDGENILSDPVLGDKGFSPYAKTVPLLIGTVANEWQTMSLWAKMDQAQSDNKNTWSKEEVKRKLREKYGDKWEKVLKAFNKAYPDKPDANALYVDSWLRNRAVKTANIKAKDGNAPVYNYVFTWETPVMGGFGMAYHCSELPFVFNNVAFTGKATGQSKEAYALADKISSAWINFAKTGNPNAKGLPNWPAYTKESGTTMILDNKSEVRYHHDDELMNVLEPNYQR